LATALIATLVFLHINGYETRLPVEQAAEWMMQVATRRKHPLDAVRQIAVPALRAPRPEPLRELAHHLIEHYEPALHALGEK
jgi:diphthamide biosynthesis methyltransferase